MKLSAGKRFSRQTLCSGVSPRVLQKGRSRRVSCIRQKLRGSRVTSVILLRLPIRVRAEQAVGETHLIDDEESEDQTDNAAGDAQAVVQPTKAFVGDGEGHGNSRSD